MPNRELLRGDPTRSAASAARPSLLLTAVCKLLTAVCKLLHEPLCKLLHQRAGPARFSVISGALRLGTSVAAWTVKAPQQRDARVAEEIR